MGDETLAAFFREADAIAARIREWNARRVEQQFAALERTIDLRVEKASEALAVQLAQKKLKASTEWVQTQQQRLLFWQQVTDQFKSCFLWFGRWLGSGFSGICFYMTSVIVYVALGTFFGVNLPTRIACPNAKSPCYLLRWDKSSVVLPSQVDDLVKKYLKSKKKQRFHRSRHRE